MVISSIFLTHFLIYDIVVNMVLGCLRLFYFFFVAAVQTGLSFHHDTEFVPISIKMIFKTWKMGFRQ